MCRMALRRSGSGRPAYSDVLKQVGMMVMAAGFSPSSRARAGNSSLHVTTTLSTRRYASHLYNIRAKSKLIPTRRPWRSKSWETAAVGAGRRTGRAPLRIIASGCSRRMMARAGLIHRNSGSNLDKSSDRLSVSE